MKYNVYKIWLITGMILFACGMFGILLLRSDRTSIIAFIAGAGIVTINLLLLGKGVSAILGYSKNKGVYIFLLILKYAFLLTTLYITIVIIKISPLPFVLGITIMPLSTMVMAIFLMLRRQDDA
jgi:hypothetical protein